MSSQTFERIKVFGRLRPSKENHSTKVVHVSDDNHLTVSLNNEPSTFQFDGLFGEDSTQEDVFDRAAARIVLGALQGYNGTIFAYGQTGSGKTHTMIGPADNCDDRGIIPRGLQLLFEELDQKRADMPGCFDAKITFSFVEIYNEHIYDLLAMTDEKLKIGQDSEGNAVVRGATEFFTKDLNDAMEEVRRGWNNRSVSATAMNRESSRSHALLLIKIRTEEVRGENSSEHISTARSAFLNLVDLAGSERVSQSKVEGERFKEMANINKSLLQLKIVIRELSEQKKNGFITFRNSALTHILKDSLGGNARTAVMINVHPDKMYYTETLSTLKFSSEVRRIENKVVVNEDLKGDSVNAYKADIRRLKEEMEKLQSKCDDELAELRRQVERWKEEAVKMERQLAVAKRHAANAAIVASKDGQGASLAESIWEKSMAEVAETARKLPTANIRSMQLRELTEKLDVCTFEKEELAAELAQEKKTKMELHERLNRYLEGTLSPARAQRPKLDLTSSFDDTTVCLPPSMLGNPLDSSVLCTPSAKSKKERRMTRFTPARDRQSNFFRPVLDADGDNVDTVGALDDTVEQRELKLELTINTHQQIIDEKTQECSELRRLLEGAEKRVNEAEANLSSALTSSEEKVKELTAEMEKATKIIAEESEKFAHLEKTSSDLEGQLIEANGQVDRLVSDIELLKSTHEDELKELEIRLKSNLSNKEKKEVDMKREIDGLKEEIEAKKVELMTKTVEKKAADGVLTQITNELLKEKGEKSAKITELENATCEVNELREAVEKKEKEREDAIKELHEGRKREGQLEERIDTLEKKMEKKKKEMKDAIMELENDRKIREGEYKEFIANLEGQITAKTKELEKERKRINEMTQSSSSQLTSLHEEMRMVRLSKDKEIDEKKAEIRNLRTVSCQFSDKMDELKAEFSEEKNKRLEAEGREKRLQEVLNVHATQNEELKENIASIGSHDNKKQKLHTFARYVEDKRLLSVRIAQLESVLKKHGVTIPMPETNEEEGREDNGGGNESVTSEAIEEEGDNRPNRRVARTGAAPLSTASAASSRTSVRSTRTTRK